MKRYTSFEEFWPHYLDEHKKASTKLVHFIGTSVGLVLLIYMFATQQWWIFPVGLISIYAVLFSSHFIFEKNKPATFRHPIYSFFADWKMWAFILTGRIKL